MIQRVWEQACKSNLDAVVVATDDMRIADEVLKFGGQYVLTDPNHRSGTDRCREALYMVEGQYDAVVNIQGDEPLIDPSLIDSLVEKLKADSRWSMATAATPILSAEDLAAKSVVKIVLDRDDGALYFSRSPIPCNRDSDADLSSGLYVRHLGIYAYRGAFLRKFISEKPCALENTEKLEQLRALWMGAKIAVVRTEDTGVGVDTPEDAVRVERILRERGA
jgi:3-deoxy-manno-octulosonate cytidylyltransferase (CMP-KDO synthetase)